MFFKKIIYNLKSTLIFYKFKIYFLKFINKLDLINESNLIIKKILQIKNNPNLFNNYVKRLLFLTNNHYIKFHKKNLPYGTAYVINDINSNTSLLSIISIYNLLKNIQIKGDYLKIVDIYCFIEVYDKNLNLNFQKKILSQSVEQGDFNNLLPDIVFQIINLFEIYKINKVLKFELIILNKI